MEYCNCIKLWSAVCRTFVLTAIFTLCCSLLIAAVEPSPSDMPIVAKCRGELAKKLNVPADSIKTVDVKNITWPDASLGMPEPGKVYMQALTPGFRIILEVNATQYLYTTSANACKYGGPVPLWSYSMLYITPTANDPNLNGELYQCSLIGTNCRPVISGVTDFYPQNNGVVIIKRRTSRSGHDLLYVKVQDTSTPKPPHTVSGSNDTMLTTTARPPHPSHGAPSVQPGDPAGTKLLYSAMDFIDAALNSTGTRWAAITRPGLGSDWNVVIAGINDAADKAQTLALPEGVKPDQIAWSGDKLMITALTGTRVTCFETQPDASKPEWKEVGCYLFPKIPDLMLNKSERLEITQTRENGKVASEVAKVWFTGDRNVVAKIDNLTLRGYDFFGGYVFIQGEMGSKPAAYTVDISTGEVIPSLIGVSRDVKPFIYAPQRSPMTVN